MGFSVTAGKTDGLFEKIRRLTYVWLNLPLFFYVIVGLLLFQSLWIALSAVYPQAFDENVHFGLIQLHAQQWTPYFTEHIPGAEVFGAVSRDPSYFYHFLMSLPYRLIADLTDSQTVQITALRLVNIGLFVAGLFVYRRLLPELGAGRRLTHVILLFFVLTPIVPLLAAQINYDNLVFVLTGMMLLAAVRFWKTLDSSQKIDALSLTQVIALGLGTGIVKYTSLPLTAGLFMVLAVVLWRRRAVLHQRSGWLLPGKSAAVIYGIIILALSGLFLERIGGNMVMYGSPSPDCAKVLSVEQCMSFSPWARDHQFSQTYPEPSLWGKIVYPVVWVHRMVFETMFVISSRFRDDSILVRYIPAPPLTVANYTAWTIIVAGSVLLVYFWRRLGEFRYLGYLLVAIAIYCVALFLKNFAMYLHSGEAVAIHGRYLVPMFPVLYLALALPFVWATDKIRRPRLKVWLFLVALLMFIHGAGLVAWIYRSTPDWYWSTEPSAPVYQINQGAQDVLHRIIIP